MRSNWRLLCLGAAWTGTEPALAQWSLDATVMQQPPTIDGQIEVSEWSGAAVLDQPFIQFVPEFSAESPYRTVVRVAQTETALYVAFEAFDPDPSRIAAAVTRRDGGLDADDSVSVAIDTFGDERTAYYFRTNSLATQEDGRIADNGRTVDDRWGAAWKSAARRHEDRWTVEFEIPFSILRYSTESAATWRINFLRTTPRNLETSLWSGPGETVWRVSSFGEIRDVRLPEQEADPWVFIPYGLAVLEDGDDADIEAGIDVRWRPSSRLGVDLTLNPDFALVEADVEEINLSRFELRVPEKRPFFLEGNEMFQQRLRQFYSRRIGDINWGAKASGKLDNFTSGDLVPAGGIGEEQADYGVIRLQQSLAKGSSVGLLASNRSFAGENTGTVGIDSTLFFTDTLGMTAQLLRVHGPTSDGGLAWFVRPAFDSSTSHFHVRYQELDPGILDDFNAVGFLTDDDRREFDTNIRHTFWFKSGAVENIRPRVNYNRYWSHEDVLRSWELDASVEVVFRNGWEAILEHLDEFKLFEKEFRNDRTVLKVGWNNRSGRSIHVFAGSGFNFDNDLKLYGATVQWPVGDRLRFSYDLTNLELEPDPDSESTLIHVFETLYSFNPDLFVKLFVQTNSAIGKENIQLLGVWRFEPPSVRCKSPTSAAPRIRGNNHNRATASLASCPGYFEFFVDHHQIRGTMRADRRIGSSMSAYKQQLTVNWGESDPFGLVYYAREVAWFNEIEHELFRQIGHPINRMITEDRSAFVMGEIQFRFVGPAAYGDRVECTLTLLEIREKTVHWHCNAVNLRTGQQVTEGKATRVFARILEDGNLQSQVIPEEIRESLSQFKADGT